MTDPSKPVHCVLLVDDESSDNFFHKRVINQTGWVEHVRVAHDGLEALEYLRGEGTFQDRIKNPRPVIIFLDINMPRMDGYEFLEAYTELPDELKADVCIFMLSTLRGTKKDVVPMEENPDVTDFISKPLTKEMLQQAIELAGVTLPAPE